MHRKSVLATVMTLFVILFPAMAPAGPLPDTGQTGDYTATFGEDSDYLINPPSYTKLDAGGNALPDDATSWAMVRDNVTGLIWENKTDDGGIHDKDNTYTWYDAQSVFIAALNAANFGGHADWRLPTPKELASIVDRSRSNPSINTAWFPFTAASAYWSSSSGANSSDGAWGVNFSNGGVGDGTKTGSYYVRAVRSGQ